MLSPRPLYKLTLPKEAAQLPTIVAAVQNGTIEQGEDFTIVKDHNY